MPENHDAKPHKRWFTYSLILAILIGSLVYLFIVNNEQTPIASAHAMYSECNDIGTSQSCYEQGFTEITKRHDVPYAIETLDYLQQIDGIQPGCHFIGHVIAFEAVAKKPSAWPEVMKQLPLEACTGGFLMGLLEARGHFETGFTLNKTTIEQTCGTLDKKLNLTCFHSMGHLVLVDSKGDIDKALSLCSQLSTEYFYECAAGIFMENLYRRNLAQHKVSNELLWNFDELKRQVELCKHYESDTAMACWREISHMIIHQYKKDKNKIFAACNSSDDPKLSKTCYLHAAGVMALVFQKGQKPQSLCSVYEKASGLYKECESAVALSISKSHIDQ
jgi:hypothetical protein